MSRPIASWLLPLVLAGAPLLVLATRAAAAAPAPVVDGADAAASSSDRLVLVLDGTLEGVTGAALRAAIAGELGVDVAVAAPGVEGRATVAVKVIEARRVLIVVRVRDGESSQRVVELPADAKLAIETIALVTSNLLRDEASGLLVELRARVTITAGSASASGAASSAASASGAASSAASTPTSASAPPPAASAPPPVRARAASICDERPTPTWWGVDFLPWLGSSTTDAGAGGVRALSFNVVAGVSRGLRGFELGGVANVETSHACGVQIAGAANVVAGPVRGVQIAGGANYAGGPLAGAQIGTANLVLGDLDGAQLGGGFSLARDVRGAQIASVNLAVGRVWGAQIGALNVAQGAVHGAQIGAVNYAGGAVSGVQLGVVNVADDAEAPIGLVSIVPHGVTHVDAWGTESGLGMLSLVHGGRTIHNVYAIGGRTGAAGSRFALSYGLGATLLRGDAFSLDLDLLGTWLVRSLSARGPTFESQLRLVAAVRLTAGVSLLVGPSYQVMNSYDPVERTQAPVGAASFGTHAGWTSTGWPGLVLGLRGL